MSATADPAMVKQALESAGEAWLFSYWGDARERHLATLAEAVQAFIDRYEQRFGERPDPFLLLRDNPLLGKAFFQIDTLSASVEMKLMVWRLLQGREIVRVRFDYEIGQAPKFSVTLKGRDGAEEQYDGTGLLDFKVMRHFAAVGVNDGLVLQGYYALRRA